MRIVQQNKAFSMIELLVAIVLLAISLLGVAGLLTSGLFTNSDSRNYTTAATLAERQLEQLKQQGFTNLTAGSYQNSQTIDSTTFVTNYTITDLNSNLKKLYVTVGWRGKSLSASTYIGGGTSP
jgi:type IV pilus assembly protein PilV